MVDFLAGETQGRLPQWWPDHRRTAATFYFEKSRQDSGFASFTSRDGPVTHEV